MACPRVQFTLYTTRYLCINQKCTIVGLGIVVGIATGYGLDYSGIESRCGRDFPHLFRPALGPTSLLYDRYWVFTEGKERPGRDADPSPPSNALVMKGYSYTSTPPMGRTACTEPQCLYKGALYLYLFLLQWHKKCTQV